jgi:leucyl-tRNA synthetase
MHKYNLYFLHFFQRLNDDLQKMSGWSEQLKSLQSQWIGKSEGTNIHFSIDGFSEKLTVFTTRADTLFGCTYVALAPESPLLSTITTKEEKKQLESFIETAKRTNEVNRCKSKEGFQLSAQAIHPLTKEKIPIFVADYVIMAYGTGAVMGVPAHDTRDFQFAEKYSVPIKTVVVDPKKPKSEGEISWKILTSF